MYLGEVDMIREVFFSSKGGGILLGNIRKSFGCNSEIRVMCKEMYETSEVQLEIR